MTLHGKTPSYTPFTDLWLRLLAMSLPTYHRFPSSPSRPPSYSNIDLHAYPAIASEKGQPLPRRTLFNTRSIIFLFCVLLFILLCLLPPDAIQSSGNRKHIVYLRAEDGTALKPAKIAFATMLTHNSDHQDDSMDNDDYFVSTRLLCYQILHAKETRNSLGAPCIVLTTPGVREDKIARLTLDGATVMRVSSIQSAWAQTDVSTWTEMFSKLHLFELTDYDLVAFMDNDVVLNAPLDKIFEDDAVVVRKSRKDARHMIEDADRMPDEYLFAGLAELNREHKYPPSEENHSFPNINYLNAGFFVFRPSKEMFEYHNSVLEIPHSFNPSLMEQNLWNYLYRQEGNMPWSRLRSTWNIHYPTAEDVELGAKSVHDKFWLPHSKDLQQYLLSWRWRMHGFYEAYTEKSNKLHSKARALEDGEYCMGTHLRG